MASVGNWVVGVSLKFQSNAKTEMLSITKMLKELREGEIARTQKAFVSLGDTMLTLGKKMDASGNIERNVFNSLSKGLTKITDQTNVAKEAVGEYAQSFNAVRDEQASTFADMRANINATNAAMRRIPKGGGGAGAGGGSGGGSGGNSGGGSGGMGGFWGKYWGHGHGGALGVGGFASGLLLPGNLAGGLNPMMIGMAVRQGIGDAIKTGAGFQQYLNVAANMGDMNAAQKTQWSRTMLDISGKTGIDPVDVMHSSLDIVRLMKGTMSTGDMANMAPKLFKAAKVLEITRGYNPTKAIDNLVEITHMLHDYKPDHMAKMLDLMLGSSELISQDPQKLKTQMAYFAGSFKNAGISDKDTFASIVMASRAGMGSGKGGTSLNNFLGAILGQADLTSFRAALRQESVQKIVGGSVDKFYYSDKKGDPKTMHIMDMIQNVATYATAHPGWKTIPELNKAFGIQGGRFAQLMSDPETVKAFMGTRKALNDPNMSVDNLYNNAMDNFTPQAQRAQNSFSVLAAAITPSLLPSLTNVARTFADMMNNISSVLTKNPHVLDGVRHMLDGLANGFVHLDKAIQHNPKMISDAIEGAKSIGSIFMAFAAIQVAGSAMKLSGLWTAAKLLSGLIVGIFPELGAIGIGSLTVAMALPAAIAAVTAALVAAIFFPKQFHTAISWVGKAFTDSVKCVSSALGTFIGNIIGAVADWFKYLNTHGPADLAKALTPKWTDPKTDFTNQATQNDAQNKAALDWFKNNIWNPLTASADAARKKHDNVPSIHHVSPRKASKVATHGHSGQQVAKVEVHLHGPVYGFADFKHQVAEAMIDLAKNPMSMLGNSLTPTQRTHPNIPQGLQVYTA